MKHAFAILWLLLTAFCLSGCTPENAYRIGSTHPGSSTERDAAHLIAALSGHEGNFTLSLRPTANSLASLRLLRRGLIDLAIIKSNLLTDNYFQRDALADGEPLSYSAIAALDEYVCHVIVPRSSPIDNVHALAGKKVAFGYRHGGTWHAAMTILSTHGLNEDAIIPFYLDTPSSLKALAAGQIDATIIVDPLSSPLIEEFAASHPVRFLPINPRLIDNLQGEYSGSVASIIPRGTYAGVTEDLPALAVNAILIARQDVPPELTEELAAIIYHEKLAATGSDGDPQQATAVLQDLSEVLAIPVHPGAARFYARHGTEVEIYDGDGQALRFGGQD